MDTEDLAERDAAMKWLIEHFGDDLKALASAVKALRDRIRTDLES
jgi:hypothetical protein